MEELILTSSCHKKKHVQQDFIRKKLSHNYPAAVSLYISAYISYISVSAVFSEASRPHCRHGTLNQKDQWSKSLYSKAFVSALRSYHSCKERAFLFNFLSCFKKAIAKLRGAESRGLLSPTEQTISSQELVYNHSCINWHQLTVTLSNKTVSELEESIREHLLRITGKVIIFHIIPSNFQTHGTEMQYSSTVNQLCITGLLNAFKPFKKCFPTAWYKLNQDVFTAVGISEGIIIYSLSISKFIPIGLSNLIEFWGLISQNTAKMQEREMVVDASSRHLQS